MKVRRPRSKIRTDADVAISLVRGGYERDITPRFFGTRDTNVARQAPRVACSHSVACNRIRREDMPFTMNGRMPTAPQPVNLRGLAGCSGRSLQLVADSRLAGPHAHLR